MKIILLFNFYIKIEEIFLFYNIYLMLKVIDLCAGTGAFTYAFESTGKAECIFANDMEKTSKDIYDINFKHALTLKDIHSIKVEDIPTHDILTGGFPCNPYSIAGKRLGFEDERSNVFWKIMEILDFHNPQFVILENVKNLVTHDNKKTFITINKNLTDRGYHVRYKILNTSTITEVPQHRERIYIIGFKSKELCDKFSLDFEKKEKLKITAMLDETVNPENSKKYYYTDGSSTWNLIKDAVVKKDTVYQYRRVYVRENKSDECPTLTANMGSGGHNVPIILDNHGIRKLTPRECFNFQGFPTTFKLPKVADSHLYKLAGNAVSIPVVELIAKRLTDLVSISE